MEYLYHGTKIQGLKELKAPIYATKNIVFAAIFINREGSLSAGWNKTNNTVAYWERKEGIFYKNYHNQKGSIYVVSKKNFKQDKTMWSEEFKSNKVVKVIKEIKINNLEKYLLDLEKENKFKFIPFNERLKYFPDDDKNLVQIGLNLVKKYGKEVLPKIKKQRPDLYNQILKRI